MQNVVVEHPTISNAEWMTVLGKLSINFLEVVTPSVRLQLAFTVEFRPTTTTSSRSWLSTSTWSACTTSTWIESTAATRCTSTRLAKAKIGLPVSKGAFCLQSARISCTTCEVGHYGTGFSCGNWN